MKKRASLLFVILCSLNLSPLTALAASGDLEVAPSSLRFSIEHLTEGRKTRIYATIRNNSSDDLYGTVKFFNKTRGEQISGDQPISIIARKTDDVFVDWIPQPGEQVIAVDISPWQKGDNTANNSFSTTVSVEADLDHDGTPDALDEDIDGDGVPNAQDAFPRDPKEWKDTDGDSIGDNADMDIDNDGVPNIQDAFPNDTKESKDTDRDGIGDNSDPDIDGDGLTNDQEKKLGTSPTDSDTDRDGVPDAKDAFPLNPTESKDTNHNGIGDNKDPDIDGDKIPNKQDPFPLNVAPIVGISNNDRPLIAKVGEPIRLDASPSYDPDGKVQVVKWIIDGKTPKEKIYQGISPTITIDQPGTHEIEVQVTDNNGETKSKKWNIFGTTSVLLTGGGLSAGIIALALLALFYYITKASRKSSKEHKEHHEH